MQLYLLYFDSIRTKKNRLQHFFCVVFLIIFYNLTKGYSYKDLNQDLKHKI